jgi:hypothetical protein
MELKVTKQQYSAQLQKWVGDYLNRIPATIGEAVIADQISTIRHREPALLNVALSKIINDALILSARQSSDEVVSAIGAQIKSRYPYFRLGELAMVIQKGINGKYGNVPGGANPVLYWVQQYDEGEREDYFVSQAAAHKETFEKAHELEARNENREHMQRISEQVKRIDAVEKAKERLKV